MSELLVRKARKGDAESFCRLMDMHLQTMYKIAWSYLKNEEDVADVLQETTLACYEKLGDLKQNRYFKTWMTRILINKCKDCLEKRSRLILRTICLKHLFMRRIMRRRSGISCWRLWTRNIVRFFCCTIWKDSIHGRSARFWK